MTSDSQAQYRCIESMIVSLREMRSLRKDEYEKICTKLAQFSSKVSSKPDQCKLVSYCSLLFYPVGSTSVAEYSNPNRSLECLQRALKLADASTTVNPAHAYLFVDLLELYLFFFEKENPVIKIGYIAGLLALTKEQLMTSTSSFNSAELEATKNQFRALLQYIQRQKGTAAGEDIFSSIQAESFMI
jgi:vacuolar protein sorting-associated protein 35